VTGQAPYSYRVSRCTPESPIESSNSWVPSRASVFLSGTSVLFVLHEWLMSGRVSPGAFGLLAAFGPGFSAEMLLLKWI
jgi:alkylresorcinol/alkylpyrone synthase